MFNRLIIGVLVVLIALTVTGGYYTIRLSGQVNDLNSQLSSYKEEQATAANSIRSELAELKNDTIEKLDAAEKIIDGIIKDIDTQQTQLDAAIVRIETIGKEAGAISDSLESIDTQLDNLDSRINDMEGNTGAVINAVDVYRQISEVTVRIGSGQSTAGSGVIYDNEGHVLTAYHVVDGLSQIYVTMHDGSFSRATVTGSCMFSDLAVLKLDNIPDIQAPYFADTSMLEIGEPVAALGSPLDLRDTLTVGVVSQVNRYTEIQYESETRWISNLIQFDAPVNPGNSGCPLANRKGEIIGIVIARVGPTTGDGIYYAVSGNKAIRIADGLITNGYYDYPWVGVGITDITPQFADEVSLDNSNGVLVGSIFSGSPAEDAGFQIGDIIIATDSVPIADSANLTSYLGEYKYPGDTISVTVLRDNTEIELTVTVGKRE